MRGRVGRWVLAGAGVLALAGGALAGGAVAVARPGRTAPVPVAGMVRQTEIRVAPETTGRLVSLAVGAGQTVRKGDRLAVLENPELAASVGEARAAAASAEADRDRVRSGVRPEEIAIAAQMVRTAEANLLLAEQQHDRAATLSANGFASRVQLDESIASLAKARADLDLKRAQHAAAVAGPTREERALADARVALARATVADLEARLAKTVLTAPVDGTVGLLVAEPGEIIAPGKPVMTLEAGGERWFTFTLREDALDGVTPGATLALATGDGRRVDARVTELRPLGEFATWRAARAVGDHDLNSFRLRLDPLERQDGLQPGMTVWLTPRS